MNDERRRAAIRVIESLEKEGFEAYLVGGCVRDYVLKKTPQDYDVATSARPEQVEAIFAHTVPTGIKHGTVTVLQDQTSVEVTTFRIESDYQDHRRPGRVKFVSSLKQDLARRDFTINAMAQDRHGRIYDYFSGIEDLNDKKVRTVGNPVERFHEDPLRMVRAARFVAQFDFELDKQTELALLKCKQQCVYLSVERVTAELEKMWKARRASKGIGILFTCGLIYSLPPFNNWKIQDVPGPDQLAPMDWTDDRIIRWAYLLFCCGVSSDNAQSRLREFRLSNTDIAAITSCFRLGAEWKSLTETTAKRLLLTEGLTNVLKASGLAKLLRRLPADVFLDKQLQKWWDEMPVTQVRELDISGKELVEHCQQPAGPWVKKTLAYLLEKVALGQLPNQKNVLLKEGCYFGANHSQ
ncbi:CCA tRNA nucleotidyltransferase [Paenactinomyces guangxiensis]|uniref:CCA tRNA nucleotidyltransferase n=1 Tax=Paenactinomyces guangxiensis TaxID=1490290 RepID=A0A7W1WR84_9BACL|nr:CCA tRNA nucleotidyltransferase [Paenactinomyces guangxiensis]MBA4494488.1 CCA tRNA nucleotidyltransferase [Paenactinomyces guangxiensis]MBH8591457.1 CCA tRNA nucleotidyltransferase [Paenactinomyces guangxiensis]